MPVPAVDDEYLLAMPAELATYLQQDLDTASATLALQSATALFTEATGGRLFGTVATRTHTVPVFGDGHLFLPRPVTSVSEVRINDTVTTGWTLIGSTLYLPGGFGYRYSFPPDVVAVDLVGDYATVPADVKLAVLQLAGELYDNPRGAVQVNERIDDYSIGEKFADLGDDQPVAPSWREIAARYRRVMIA